MKWFFLRTQIDENLCVSWGYECVLQDKSVDARKVKRGENKRFAVNDIIESFILTPFHLDYDMFGHTDLGFHFWWFPVNVEKQKCYLWGVLI